MNISSMNQLKKQRGFTLVELVIVLVVIAGLTIVLLPKIQQVMGLGDAAKLKAQVSEIQSGALLYKQREMVFTGIDMETLDDQGFISDRMGDGVAINPWGGDYSVESNSSNATQYIITVDGILSEDIGSQAEADYATSAVTTDFDGSTLTLTFQG
ncbi:prepilin-type N-terminal cleavage/methylation domain-containing protein [Pseudoalteromonas sp. GutCa3]|uniref:prepilin-type N-terminal cleavage/methylation domain-containing protein n=1 Tax=Pseudoalteromonas sp. GutCa3 TaxID=888433 RepID=UPI000C33EA36|nr:prepilin-type N-terminal cleavage/methylation domain-containing protein [Pseudoalteromonas sp. GutCa3]PKG68621.1 hypothetical protein CXF64_20070 [Pseudoalteromonas sp. GutCa3]